VAENDDLNDLGPKLREAERRLAQHPGYQEYVLLLSFERSLTNVFISNWNELLGLLEQVATNPVLALEMIQNVRPPEVRDQFQAAITQRLHNYVAGTMTLVEHSRRVMGKRSGAICNDFAKRKQELLTNPEIPFMQDLRNFTLHRSLPFLGHSLSVVNVNAPDQAMTSEVQLSVSELLESDGWTAPSRGFLEAQGDVVTLRPLVRKHGRLTLEINMWLHDALASANAEALADANRLVIERNAILTGADLSDAERLTRQWTEMRSSEVQRETPP
jgi:hypothetical protein